MKVVEHFIRTGDLLFRWRSYLPLVLLPLFVASFIGLHYPYHSHAFGLAWEIGWGFFVLDVMEDFRVTGRIDFDPLWTWGR